MLARAWGFKSLLRYQNKNSGLENLRDFSDPFVFSDIPFCPQHAPNMYKCSAPMHAAGSSTHTWHASVQTPASHPAATAAHVKLALTAGSELAGDSFLTSAASLCAPHSPPLPPHPKDSARSSHAPFLKNGSSCRVSASGCCGPQRVADIDGIKTAEKWKKCLSITGSAHKEHAAKRMSYAS